MIITTKYRYPALFFGVVVFFIGYNWLTRQGYTPAHIYNPFTFGGPSRQMLWNEIHHVFEAHAPLPLDHLKWKQPWPTMPQYVMNKTFDEAEVKQFSPELSTEMMEAMRQQMQALQKEMPNWSKYKKISSGRGYVMATGGFFLDRVFPVGIQMLHRLGSKLPIEIWTKDEGEYKNTVKVVEGLAKDFGMRITCYKFSDYLNITEFPDGYNQNYLMKALTILMSSFEEVILLDADNVPMLSPEPLLESKEYAETGLILWPDFWANSASSTLHELLNFPYNFFRTCESGQIVLDKRKHFESLILACYYNWYGDPFYKLLTLDGMGAGDKDTFVLGAQTLGRKFHFTERPLELMRAVYLNGTQWHDDTSVFNGAMGQFNPLNMKQIMFMHMHAPKLNFQQFLDVTLDLVFVRTDAKDVEFFPSADHLEKLLWESVSWVECDSVLRLENDPRKMCEGIQDRVKTMKSA
ncbi:mannosyltransferase putative-domain-containing protein [Bisporella sp. PMI_857]|nr:mannosyltransferase putative-domain-containing protein [Bisporella sp. PMI_857]